MEGCKAKTLVILIGAIVLCANILGCSSSSTSTSTNTFNTTSNAQFIKSSCDTSTFPEVCVKSLSSYSHKIQSSYPKLAYTALSISLKSAESTTKMVSKLVEGKELKRNEIYALKDCVKNIGNSIEGLTQSVKEAKTLNASNYKSKMSKIMTWVSAALEDDDRCMEGLDEETVNGKVKYIIKKHVWKVAELTSNALAFVNGLSYTKL